MASVSAFAIPVSRRAASAFGVLILVALLTVLIVVPLGSILLQAVSHTGDGRMSKVTYVQRLDTAGGLAPAAGCDADHVGKEADVDYTATYYFYRASPVRGHR
jgi:hypothetical protein